MFRVAWWLILAQAVHCAVIAVQEFVGLVPDSDVAHSLIFYVVQYGVALACARRHLGEPWTELAPCRRMSTWLVVPIAIMTAGGLLLNATSIRICELMNVLSPEILGAADPGTTPAYESPLLEDLVSRALFPAVFEEASFRGLALTALAATMSKRRAIFISALFFAVSHFRMERMPDTFLMGMAYGWLFVRTGSVLPGMLAHFLHNSACVLFPASDLVPLPAEWLAMDRYGLLPAGTVWAGAGLVVASMLVIRMSVGRRKVTRSYEQIASRVATCPPTGAGRSPSTAG